MTLYKARVRRNVRIGLPLHLPDLPGPWVGSVQGVPVAADILAFREHFGADGMHKGIDVDGYEVVLLDGDALDLLDQALAFSQIGAGLMFGPALFNLWCAEQGGWAITHGVDPNNGLGTPWPCVDILHDDTIARVALAALGNLGSESRPL